MTHTLVKLLWDTTDSYVFEYKKKLPLILEEDTGIQHHVRLDNVKPQHIQILFPKTWKQLMYRRFRHGDAELLTYVIDDRPVAYGWIQNWKPFRHKFGMIHQDAIMLGPYWTHPDQRGKGIYGKMLRKSLSLCDGSKPVIIYTTPNNTISQRGIYKAGFSYIGTYHITLRFRRFASWQITQTPGDKIQMVEQNQ